MPITPKPSEGADFTETVKLEAKKRAAFKCCMCHNRAGDEVHRITPKAEGGTNDIENAVLLCAQCHLDNGSRLERRKFITQARDWWYEQVRRRYQPENITQLVQLDKLVTKDDLDGLQTAVQILVKDLFASMRQGSTSPAEAVNVASTMVSSISSRPSHAAYTSISGAACPRCAAGMGLTTLGYKCGFCDSPRA